MTEEDKIKKVFNNPATREEECKWNDKSKAERLEKLNEIVKEVNNKYAENTAQGLYIHKKVIEYNRPKPKQP